MQAVAGCMVPMRAAAPVTSAANRPLTLRRQCRYTTADRRSALQVVSLADGPFGLNAKTLGASACATVGSVIEPLGAKYHAVCNHLAGRRSVAIPCLGSGSGDGGDGGGKKVTGGNGNNQPPEEPEDDKVLPLAEDLPITGWFMQNVPWARDRLLADDKFLFKVVAEVLIDTGCATVAEVRKRGDDFWHEFEFYLSDLVVGVVLDVALVTLMAPVAVVGALSKAQMATGALQKWVASVPSAVFEASIPGVRTYNVGQRLGCLAVKFCEYSLAGMICGFIGQGFANSFMMLRRHVQGESEDDVKVPPLVGTALVWGLFLGVSANVRYQVVFGLERAVDLTIARSVPQIAYGTTIAIRFVNNVIGGENFIDMARYFGVQ